jgi:hypothetical protein
MPYIDPDRRPAVTPTTPGKPETIGEINFMITTIIDRYLKDKGINYSNYNAVIGVLECAKLELYIRCVQEYEIIKLLENGDVYTNRDSIDGVKLKSINSILPKGGLQ